MSLIATPQDFEPANPTEGEAALYYAPGAADGIVGYHQYPFFQSRIDGLKGRFAPNNQKLAIWGCGFGYLVSLAVSAGYDAYGFDASAYAISRGKTLIPSIAARLFVRDALVAADVTAAKNDAGLKGNVRFALLLSEDLFTCMSDAEIQTALPLLRGICSANLGHMLTVLEQAGTNNDPRINWKQTAAWKAIFSPPDVVLGVNGEAL
jgi:hypothetical protein